MMSAIKKLGTGNLRSKLIDLIRLRGPLTVSDYMKIVLTNPESGFYMNEDVFGVKGHFTTSPEVSQTFGEILGAWILQEWKRYDCPKPLKLVEFGPGRGTLMCDIARTLNSFKQTHNNVHINLIDMSPHLKEVQRVNLDKQSQSIQSINWFSHLDSLEDDKTGFTAYIAHEFLDALPIHKFVRDPITKRWRELLVDYGQNEELRFCISKKPSLSTHLLIPEDFKGDHIEVCPQAAMQLEKVASRLNHSGKGCMLICDYGFEEGQENADENGTPTALKPYKSSRDTFRAFKNHESWPPLKDPGEADLTADVDFGYLKKHLHDKALLFGSVNQKDFLTKCGIQIRLETLLANANEEERQDLQSGASMLIDEMGQRYRFLAMFPKGTEHLFEADPPAGFY